MFSRGDELSGALRGANQLRGANDEELRASQFETDNGLIPGTIMRLAQETGLSVDALIFAYEEDPSLISTVLAENLFPEPAPRGAAGRTMFPEESALLQEQAKTQAFSRARDRMLLMQATDQLLDARRESAMDAMIAAAPFMVAPGTEFTPGLEPGGAGVELGQLLGANVQPQRLPTVELPINELVNAPISAGQQQIDEALLPLLNA
jgi:hypothetical protein